MAPPDSKCLLNPRRCAHSFGGNGFGLVEAGALALVLRESGCPSQAARGARVGCCRCNGQRTRVRSGRFRPEPRRGRTLTCAQTSVAAYPRLVEVVRTLLERHPGIGTEAMVAHTKMESPELRDVVNAKAVRVSKAATPNAEGARVDAKEGLAALCEPLDADDEFAAALVAPGGGAAGGTARVSRDTVETGAHRAAPKRPPRAYSGDVDEPHEGVAAARDASGGALVVIGRWREAVLRLRSGGTQPTGEDVALGGVRLLSSRRLRTAASSIYCHSRC